MYLGPFEVVVIFDGNPNKVDDVLLLISLKPYFDACEIPIFFCFNCHFSTRTRSVTSRSGVSWLLQVSAIPHLGLIARRSSQVVAWREYIWAWISMMAKYMGFIMVNYRVSNSLWENMGFHFFIRRLMGGQFLLLSICARNGRLNISLSRYR